MPFVSSVRGSFGPQAKSRRNYNSDMLSRISGGSTAIIGGYRIHTFTPGTSSFNTTSWGTTLAVDYLVVGGGGSAGSRRGGGGGAGGYISGSTTLSAANHTVTVASGGSV